MSVLSDAPYRPRRIGLVSTSRADAGIYRPLIQSLLVAGLDATCFAGGTHPLPAFGRTLREFDDLRGLRVVPIDHFVEGDAPAMVARSAGRAVDAFAAAYAEHRPELLFVLGDRYEMLAAAMAAVPFNIVLAHLYGGETTLGAYDDACRHAITKLSHLHFAAHEAYAARIVAMGEAAWRIHTVGPLAWDALRETPPLPVEALSRETGVDFSRPTVLVVFHPETISSLSPEQQVDTLLKGLETGLLNQASMHERSSGILIIEPNADVGREIIAQRLRAFARRHPRTHIVPTLPAAVFRSAMAHATVMVGNSSAGIIEAPYYGVSVINVGDRQKGRVRSGNMVDVSLNSDQIADRVASAMSGDHERPSSWKANAFGDRPVARNIVVAISTLPHFKAMMTKE